MDDEGIAEMFMDDNIVADVASESFNKRYIPVFLWQSTDLCDKMSLIVPYSLVVRRPSVTSALHL